MRRIRWGRPHGQLLTSSYSETTSWSRRYTDRIVNQFILQLLEKAQPSGLEKPPVRRHFQISCRFTEKWSIFVRTAYMPPPWTHGLPSKLHLGINHEGQLNFMWVRLTRLQTICCECSLINYSDLPTVLVLFACCALLRTY